MSLRRGAVLLSALSLSLPSPSPAAFRDRGWGARGLGMGRAHAALADDAAALFWNPAGTARLESSRASFLWRNEYPGLSDINVGSGSAASLAPTAIGVVGAAVTEYSVGGLSHEAAYILHFSHSLGAGAALGVNAKYLHHGYQSDADPSAASNPVFNQGTQMGAFTADAGIKTRLFSGVTLGLAGRNLTSPDVGIASSDRVPAEYQAGLAWRPWESLTLEADGIYRSQRFGSTDDKLNGALGLEQTLFSRATWPVVLRLGGNMREASAGATFGTGLSGVGFLLEYAYVVPVGAVRGTGGTHHMGMSFVFAPPEPEPARPRRVRPGPVSRPAPLPAVEEREEPAPPPPAAPAPVREEIPAPLPEAPAGPSKEEAPAAVPAAPAPAETAAPAPRAMEEVPAEEKAPAAPAPAPAPSPEAKPKTKSVPAAKKKPSSSAKKPKPAAPAAAKKAPVPASAPAEAKPAAGPRRTVPTATGTRRKGKGKPKPKAKTPPKRRALRPAAG